MTQPSLNTTFDTSLIDLAASASFSTTESWPSDQGTKTEQVSEHSNFTQTAGPSLADPLESQFLIIASSQDDDEASSRFTDLIYSHKTQGTPLRLGILDQCINSEIYEGIRSMIHYPTVSNEQSSPWNRQGREAETSVNLKFDGLIASIQPGPLAMDSQLSQLKSLLQPDGCLLVVIDGKAQGIQSRDVKLAAQGIGFRVVEETTKSSEP